MKVARVDIPCVGYSIVADWYEGTNDDQILLVLPGWTSTRLSYGDFTQHMVENTGAGALVLDYSGHGDSPFDAYDMRPAQHFLEVINAFDWLKQKHPKAHISVIGTSYGGYLAAQLTKYREFDNLVLRVPAIYPPKDFYTPHKDMDNELMSKFYRNDSKELAKHPLFQRAAGFKGKTLVVVHENDQIIPPETTEQFIKTFAADMHLAKGFPHSFNEAASDEEKLAYKNAVSDWLNAHLA